MLQSKLPETKSEEDREKDQLTTPEALQSEVGGYHSKRSQLIESYKQKMFPYSSREQDQEPMPELKIKETAKVYEEIMNEYEVLL